MDTTCLLPVIYHCIITHDARAQGPGFVMSYLVPTKYLFLPYSQTQSSEIPYCLEVTNLSSEEFCSLDRTSNSVCQIKRKLRTPRRKNNSSAGVTLKV